MGRKLVLGSLFFFVAITSAAIFGLLSFIPGPIGVLIGISSLLFLLITRLQFHLSGNVE